MRFLEAIQGIDTEIERERYAALMLNRLMFTYFLQKTGFLEDDTDYLASQLKRVQRDEGMNRFYRAFLLGLFHEGLGAPTHARGGRRGDESPDAINRVPTGMGDVPYLDGGLFAQHRLEKSYPSIQIDDVAFEELFAFFDAYHWYLDELPGQHDNEINPDILGYIFEKYINHQQMGAYYTREDVTAYIAKNCIIPALFDAVERLCPQVLGEDGVVWGLLRDDPERYIPWAIRCEGYLPTETGREYEMRRSYYKQLRARICGGEMRSIDDFITYNLDIGLFAQDVLRSIEEPEVLYVFYEQIRRLRILDPTCGSGAFLFAALRVLVPLYEACLPVEACLACAVRPCVRTCSVCLITHGHTAHARHASTGSTDPSISRRRYFILKSIISNNLYGVDIMEEAIEICKFRLFLTLVAAIEKVGDLEPLPDIDHHMRVGNALVGFTGMLRGDESPDAINRVPTEIEPELFVKGNRLLAKECGVDVEDRVAFEQWRRSHQPFHWGCEFAEVIGNGGFDCIIGNPPYVEYADKRFHYNLQGFRTLSCGNLYPCVIERSRELLSAHGRQGMILPLAAFATRNMIPLLEGFQEWFAGSWLSFYHFRPSMLFSGGKVASIPTAIYLARVTSPVQRFSTHVAKWSTDQRDHLFSLLTYSRITVSGDAANQHYYPKFGRVCENAIMEKVLRHRQVATYLADTPNENKMFYRSAGGLYWKIFINFPWPYRTTSNKQCAFLEGYERDVFVALFNSSLFWWYYTVTFDTFNLKDYMLFGFRFSYPEDVGIVGELQEQCQRLMEDFRRNAQHLKRGETGSYTIYGRKSKAIIDDIDRVLARHYGFSEEELDFILHYDIKYRMGADLSNGDCEP